MVYIYIYAFNLGYVDGQCYHVAYMDPMGYTMHG